MNPVTAVKELLAALPRPVRLVLYAVLGLAALVVAAYKASEGDWLEFTGLLLGSLGFSTAASNLPDPDAD